MRELEFRNLQRAYRVSPKKFREILHWTLDEELKLGAYQVAFQLVSPGRMAQINEHFLNHSGSTDVITFDYRHGYDHTGEPLEKLDLAGEIYISPHDAETQGRNFAKSWQEEVIRYAVHGALHLIGFDDLEPLPRRLMKREENRIMRKLGLRFPLNAISS